MMNEDTRRLQKLNDEVSDEFTVFAPKTLRLAFPEENNASLKKIAKLDEPAYYSKVGLVPRRADVDMNRHVNNVTCIVWILESMHQEIIDSHELQAITLNFRRECRQDDIVDSLASPDIAVDVKSDTGDENGCLQFLHSLRLSKDGSEICRGRTRWRKKPAEG